jgi:hypothetical protein
MTMMLDQNEQDAQDSVSDERIPLFLESSESHEDDDLDYDDKQRQHVRDHPSTAQRSLGIALLLLRQYMFLGSNIGAWYVTNGMNGIAMQSFSRALAEHQQQQVTTTSTRGFGATVAITSMVTSLQLLLGAILGWFMLLLYRYRYSTAMTHEPSTRIANEAPRSNLLTFRPSERFLALLHGVGSICTNLGFMYGSASLVQILKLLEPFETLVLTKLLLPEGEEGNKLTIGVLSSCLLTVGSAISLLNSSSSKEPHPHAIMFAIASGLSLSSRNVLQRRQHFGKKPTVTTIPTTTTNSERNMRSPQTASKLERSLLQFTELSLQSGTAMGLVSILLHAFLLYKDKNHGATLTGVLSHAINWRLLTWHPLYNAFSMITLGFCSALTHSLLNAGKRVFAICMAIFWFRESHGWATTVSLAAVTVGGCWYATETKATGRVASSSSWTVWTKPLAALMLLILVYAVVQLESKTR